MVYVGADFSPPFFLGRLFNIMHAGSAHFLRAEFLEVFRTWNMAAHRLTNDGDILR